MKLRHEQLDAHLRQGLAPIYLIHGAEPLLVQETADAIRDAARRQGHGERECLTVEAGFDWNRFLETAASPSLFTPQRLLELRLEQSKPGDAGAKALRAYAQRPAADATLLIRCGKLDAATRKSRWFTELEKAGVSLQIWPVEARQLPAWIEARMRAKGLRPGPEATALLAQRVEGNLLAAAQEIDKLQVLFGNATISVERLSDVVGESARYSVYDLVDAALAGNPERTLRVIHGLRGEGVEIALTSWALRREIGLLATLAFECANGAGVEATLTRHRVWEKRKPLLRRALGRLPLPACRRLLRRCGKLDQQVKGIESGDPWDETMQLSLALAGRNLLKCNH